MVRMSVNALIDRFVERNTLANALPEQNMSWPLSVKKWFSENWKKSQAHTGMMKYSTISVCIWDPHICTQCQERTYSQNSCRCQKMFLWQMGKLSYTLLSCNQILWSSWCRAIDLCEQILHHELLQMNL